MSKVLTEYSGTISTILAHHPFMAAAKMGHQHSRTVDDSTRKLQVCSGGGGVFHKMDRGEASSQHCRSGTEEIFLAEHNMSFWSAQRYNSRQRQAIRLQHIQGFLTSDEGSKQLSHQYITLNPMEQWKK
jgi:hypothetical protein